MKTVQDLAAAIQNLAEFPEKFTFYSKQIDECLQQRDPEIDPFELYVVNGQDRYVSAFEAALLTANTVVIEKILGRYKNNTELLLNKLSRFTDNLEDTSINKPDGSTIRAEMNFLQCAAISSSVKVVSLICNMFGDDGYLKQSKKLADLINHPIKVHGKRVTSYGLAEYMTFRYSPSSMLTAPFGSLDMDFYKNHPEQRDAALAFVKSQKFYTPKQGAAPTPPIQTLRFILNHKAIFAYLMGIDSIDLEVPATAIPANRAPFFELLEDVANCAKDSQEWPGCSNRIHVGGAKGTGYIEDEVPFIKIEGFTNTFGFAPVDGIVRCDELIEISEMASKYVTTKHEERTRRRSSEFAAIKAKQGALEAGHTELQAVVVDIKAEMAKLVQKMDEQAIISIAAYGERHDNSQHSADSISTGSGKKGSPGKGSPQHGSQEDILKKARLDFYCAIRNDLEEKLGLAVSKKGRTDFFHNHNLNLFVTALSYGAYAVAPPGLQGVVAIPIQMAGDWLQTAQAEEKGKRFVCEITSADRSIEAKRKMAILIAWGITSSLGEQINVAAGKKGQLDKMIATSTAVVSEGIKALASPKYANQPNPIGFFQNMVVAEVKDSLNPGKKPGCVIS